jgi:hypothetical protein
MTTSMKSSAYEAHYADLENRARRMVGVAGAVAIGEAQNASAIAYDADSIVGELVRQYLQCSTTMSGSFCF